MKLSLSPFPFLSPPEALALILLLKTIESVVLYIHWFLWNQLMMGCVHEDQYCVEFESLVTYTNQLKRHT